MRFIELGKEALQMRAIYSILFFISSITPFLAAQAAPQKFKVGDHEFNIDVPKDWQVQRDFFFPVGIVGPDNKEGHRTVIGITTTDVVDSEQIFEKADKDIKPYIEGREEWLTKQDGKATSYDPYQKLQWKGIEAAHVLGYHYEIPSGKFHERSFYIFCNGAKLVNIKTLVYGKYENEHDALVDKTVKSFQCVGKTVAQNSVKGGH